MCYLCDVIYKNEQEYKDSVTSFWDEGIVLIKNNKDEIGIYIPIENDHYYSDSYLFGMKCCPICGRELFEGENEIE